MNIYGLLLKKIRTIVIDDEINAREGLCSLLGADSDIEVIASCKLGSEAVIKINSLKPDLIFLDIQMPEIDGFKVLELIDPACMPITIFVTAYDQYALKAFKVHALDYILKPFDDETFYKALNRAKQYFDLSDKKELQKKLLSLFNTGRLDDMLAEEGISGSKLQYLNKIKIRKKDETFFLDSGKIDVIEANNYYVTIYSGTNKYLLRETLNNFERMLTPDLFIRIHRCIIINVNNIKSFNFKKRIITDNYLKEYKLSLSGIKNIKNHPFFTHSTN